LISTIQIRFSRAISGDASNLIVVGRRTNDRAHRRGTRTVNSADSWNGRCTTVKAEY